MPGERGAGPALAARGGAPGPPCGLRARSGRRPRPGRWVRLSSLLHARPSACMPPSVSAAGSRRRSEFGISEVRHFPSDVLDRSAFAVRALGAAAPNSYPITGFSAVTSIGLRSSARLMLSRFDREAGNPLCQPALARRSPAVRTLSRLYATSGNMTFSWKFPDCTRHRNTGVVADHLRAEHGNGLGNHGIHLAGHDAPARLQGRQFDFARRRPADRNSSSAGHSRSWSRLTARVRSCPEPFHRGVLCCSSPRTCWPQP